MTFEYSPGCGLLTRLEATSVNIRRWDCQAENSHSGVLLQTLKVNLDLVLAVTFSPENKLLAPSLRDWTAKLCTLAYEHILRPSMAMGYRLNIMNSSPNAKLLALALGFRFATLCDPNSGEVLLTLLGQEYRFNSIDFSLDKKLQCIRIVGQDCDAVGPELGGTVTDAQVRFECDKLRSYFNKQQDTSVSNMGRKYQAMRRLLGNRAADEWSWRYFWIPFVLWSQDIHPDK